jgi:hypothetical protein
MIDIDKITIGDAKKLASMFQNQPQTAAVPPECPWKLGAIYLIRTVTMIDTGRLVQVTPQELVLEDAAWIADTGRFHSALLSSDFSEIEPFPDGRVIIGRGSIVDAVEIKTINRSAK